MDDFLFWLMGALMLGSLILYVVVWWLFPELVGASRSGDNQ